MQLINNQNCTFISVNHSVKPFSDRGFQVEMLLLQNIACTLGCFYIPNPLLGSSFWVLLTLSFSLSSWNFISNHSRSDIPSMCTEHDTMTYIRAGSCVRTCSPMRTYVWAYATVCVDRCVRTHFTNRGAKCG